MQFSLFYAWQSDRPKKHNHYFIRDAAKKAAKLIDQDSEVEESPRVDYDTWNIPGTPEIAGTIFRRIECSGLFLADLTYVGTIDPKTGGSVRKQAPNPNVLVELGYAAAKLGWDRIILVMNTAFGHPDEMIFDLVHRRWPQCYNLGPDDERKKKEQFDRLVEMLRIQIRLAMDADHERTRDVVSKLDISCYHILKTYGRQDSFPLPEMVTKGDVIDFQRYHQAAARLLDLGVIEARYDPRQNLYAYHWTYHGKLTLIKLGIRQPSRPSPYSPVYYTFTEIVDMTKNYNNGGPSAAGWLTDFHL